MRLKPLILIMGPTASGKSAVAFEIAKKIPAEIISADSMQIYKGLDIGTAKPSENERSTVRHHLIDLLDISEPLNVYTYVELAETAIREIRGRGNFPLIVGGTGLYLRALIYGLDPLPANPELRKTLEKNYSGEEGFQKLLEIMQARDSAAFSKWHNNHRKLLRALEILELTGKSIIELQKSWKSEIKTPSVSWFLVWDRKLLRKRIEQRTEKMLESGWLKEAETMIKRGLLQSPTAWQALGYSIIAEYLDKKIPYHVMKEKIVTSTWRLARRQDTWFRNKHPEAEWIYMPANTDELLVKLKD